MSKEEIKKVKKTKKRARRKVPVKKVRRIDKDPVTGRKPVYNQNIADYICDQLMRGRSLTSIAKEKGIPSMPVIYSWLGRNSPHFKEEFLNSYLDAREIQACTMADQCLDIADDNTNDTHKIWDENKEEYVTVVSKDIIQRSKLRVEVRQWLAAHLLPRKFSRQLQLTGADGRDLIPPAPTKVVFNFIDSNEKKDNDE